MNRVITLALLALLTASASHAAPGTNLRWIDCFGDAGLINRNFACNTNTGFETLVGSFELGADILNASGLEVVIDIGSQTSPLPAWWHFKNAGTCRATSLSLSTVPPLNASVCQDWSSGQALGGIGVYIIGTNLRGPNWARLTAALAVPATGLAELVTGQEYFGFQFRILHNKTVGTGACEGCCTRAAILFNAIKVTTPVPQDDRVISGATNGTDSNYALWQGGYRFFAPSGSSMAEPAPPCGETVPTRSRTWSEVKALYR
ncbi:MAG: hypothetical protein K8R56_03780 [Candidatus Eisenbacteria bacterium]|nr:hypothetical protein [Candidatus Eisenbacteria bacterium]